MATIDRPQLCEDIIFWLPDSNTLTDQKLLVISNYIISSVGDDDSNYAEVLCKSLKAAALKNLSDATAASGGLKKEKVGEHEQEFFQGGLESVWKTYINSLKDICPLFGYSPMATLGLQIAPGDKIDVLCPQTTDDTELFL